MATGEDDADTYKTWMGEDQEPRPGVHAGGRTGPLRKFHRLRDQPKEGKPERPIEEGHISCGLVHLANASYRLGRTLNFNPETQQVIGDPEAAVLLRDGDRGYRAPFVVPEVS